MFHGPQSNSLDAELGGQCSSGVSSISQVFHIISHIYQPLCLISQIIWPPMIQTLGLRWFWYLFGLLAPDSSNIWLNFLSQMDSLAWLVLV